MNLSLTDAYWLNRLQDISDNAQFGQLPLQTEKVVLEYCGPNTNKPLHIGHVRNMLLGFSMSEILKAAGYPVTKVNIYNDRGIAICQSMVAYRHFANGATPQSSGIKGDHFVGDWYVKFNQVAKEQMAELQNAPEDKDEAKKLTPIFKEAQETLLKWEAGDAETIALWEQMNAWVYEGFQQTFDMIGVDFQKDYYESQTYKMGKEIVDEVTFTQQVTDSGYARVPNGTGAFKIQWQTFNANNSPVAIDTTEDTTTTGIIELKNKVVMNLYPNPTNGKLHILLSGGDDNGTKVAITNMLGQPVEELNYEEHIIVSTDGWADGVYLVRYGNITKRLVVQH